MAVPAPETPPERRSGKSADAFRTISEVADELGLPQHVLRFWETKFAAVKPLKRGGGRRYYRPEDVRLLAAIKGLLHDDGYTIKGVQKLLRESGGRLARPEAPPPAPAQPVAPTAGADDGGDGEPALRAELEGIARELEDLRSLIAAET